jgi:hypothetical protein
VFAVGPVLVTDDLLDAPFCCALSACKGACCVEGERGAPLLPDERAEIEAAWQLLAPKLRPEARRAVEAEGQAWEGDEDAGYATVTVGAVTNQRDGAGACVFVTYDKAGVAGCAIQQAHQAGTFGWPKPVSCHLFPIRVETYPGADGEPLHVLNVERIDLCRPAVPHGRRAGIQLADFVLGPLARRFGDDWAERFRTALAERRAALEIDVRNTPSA